MNQEAWLRNSKTSTWEKGEGLEGGPRPCSETVDSPSSSLFCRNGEVLRWCPKYPAHYSFWENTHFSLTLSRRAKLSHFCSSIFSSLRLEGTRRAIDTSLPRVHKPTQQSRFSPEETTQHLFQGYTCQNPQSFCQHPLKNSAVRKAKDYLKLFNATKRTERKSKSMSPSPCNPCDSRE